MVMLLMSVYVESTIENHELQNVWWSQILLLPPLQGRSFATRHKRTFVSLLLVLGVCISYTDEHTSGKAEMIIRTSRLVVSPCQPQFLIVN